MKKSFLLYGEWEQHFALLSPSQQGALAMALFAYGNRGELPQGDPAVSMAFSFMRAAIDDNDAKWERERAAKAEAGRAGGLAKASKASTANQRQAGASKSSLYVSGSVSGSVSVPSEEGVRKECAGKPRFAPPTLEEVTVYVTERKSPVVPQEFIDFYASKGWMVGKTPMKDWKAACRNAEKWDRWSRSAPSATKPAPHPSKGSFADLAAKMEREGKL